MVQEWEQEAGSLTSPSLFPFPHRVRCTGSGCSSPVLHRSTAILTSPSWTPMAILLFLSSQEQHISAYRCSHQKAWLFLARPKTHLVQFLASDKSWQWALEERSNSRTATRCCLSECSLSDVGSKQLGFRSQRLCLHLCLTAFSGDVLRCF